MSDGKVGGLDFQKPAGNPAPVSPATLNQNVPAPFKAEPSGGMGIRLHHKFAVIDFDKPTARVWTGSYNFSDPADTRNGENLLLIKDRRVATAYMVEALRLFDHYHFRLAKRTAADAAKPFVLAKPPRAAGETPLWWQEYYETAVKIRDREMFA